MAGETETRIRLEPGPGLEDALRQIEERIHAGEPVAGEWGLALVNCVRELLSERAALLEELEVLELAANRPAQE